MTVREKAEEWARDNHANDWGILIDPMGGAVGAYVAGYRAALESPKQIVDEQAQDEGLWFPATTAVEAYLQQELRRLHRAIERELGE